MSQAVATVTSTFWRLCRTRFRLAQLMVSTRTRRMASGKPATLLCFTSPKFLSSEVICNLVDVEMKRDLGSSFDGQPA
jgi:hypothetical protein